jgi:hypothetical protein
MLGLTENSTVLTGSGKLLWKNCFEFQPKPIQFGVGKCCRILLVLEQSNDRQTDTCEDKKQKSVNVVIFVMQQENDPDHGVRQLLEEIEQTRFVRNRQFD